MPTFTSRSDIAQQLVTAITKDFDREREERSDATRVHVSEVIYCLRKSWRKRQPQFAGCCDELPTPDNMTLLTGQAWDQIAARAKSPDYWPKMVVRSTELVGEADALGVVDGEPVVWEHKTTAAGIKQPIPERYPHYVEQGASYLSLTGVRRLIIAVLHLAMPKTLKVWDIRFTEDELRRWGEELVRRARLVMGDVEPSVDECAPANDKKNISWESNYCAFFVGNGGDCPCSPGRPASWFALDREEVEDII